MTTDAPKPLTPLEAIDNVQRFIGSIVLTRGYGAEAHND